MKKLIMNSIFKKELDVIHKRYEMELKRKINLIEKNAQDEIIGVKKSSEISKRIFSLFKNAEIIGIEENKHEEVYVFKTYNQSFLTIHLCSKSYQAINGLPRIMAVVDTNTNHLKILDVQTEDLDIGNGSILMKYLVETVGKMKVSRITGDLSSVDMNHFSRSEHYYKKFGFNVKFDDSRTSGTIELKI